MNKDMNKGQSALPTDGTSRVELRVNGESHELAIRDDELLVATMRERLDLGSVREACGIGICGSCTVLVDGRAVSSCSTLTHQVCGRTLTTSEGLVDETGGVSRVQQAFIDAEAFQCSFCIPGFVLTLTALLDRNPEASYAEARTELEGNLCRCGSYPRIMAAVRDLLTPAEHAASNGVGDQP